MAAFGLDQTFMPHVCVLPYKRLCVQCMSLQQVDDPIPSQVTPIPLCYINLASGLALSIFHSNVFYKTMAQQYL